MIARLRRVVSQGDSGFTLVELLVAMVVTGIVLALASTFFVNVARLTIASNTGRAAVSQAQLATSAIRNAVTMAADNPTSLSATTPAIMTGTSNSLTVISWSNTTAGAPAPSQVTFTVGATGFLTETRTLGVLDPATGYWAFTGVVKTRQVAGPFNMAVGTSFFSYLTATGTVIALPVTGLATPDLKKVAFVRVTPHVDAKTSTGATQPFVLTTTIGLTNLYRDVDSSMSLPALSGGQ